MADTPYFQDRFKVAAHYYTTGRPTYPKLLSRRVAEYVGLEKHDNVLDLGTGPGFLAIDFSPLAKSVTAVDPAPEMLEAARENIARAALSIRLIQARAEELTPELGRFKLVTIGRAFHWMDRIETLKFLDSVLVPGGAVALFKERYPEVPVNAWQPEFQSIIDAYSTQDPARPFTRAAVKHEAILLDSVFNHVERLAVFEPRETEVERFVDRALSFASTWHGRSGSRLDDLAVEIRELMTKYADERGIVRELLEGQALIARRARDLDRG